MTDHTVKEDMNAKDKNTENTETNTTKNEDADESSLRAKFKEIVKEGSGLTILKVLATALTAVSMSLLSANLTGVINSLMLVALVSVGTAIVSEFYRILLSVTSLGAKKVVAPVIHVKTVKDGNTVRTITEEVVVLNEDGTRTTDKNDEEQLQAKEEEIAAENRIHQLEQEVVDTGRGRRRLVIAKLHQRFGEYFKKNPFMKFIALFAGIAILTIGTSYFVSEKNQNTDNIFTTVYKTEEKRETLSEAEKQAIIDEAVKQAQEKTPERTIVEKETEVQVPVDDKDEEANNNSSSTSTVEDSENTSNSQNNTDDTTSRTDDNNSTGSDSSTGSNSTSDETMKELEDRIKQLEEDNKTLQKELTTLRNNQNTSTNSDSSSSSPTVEELEEQIRLMQEEIDALSTGNDTSQGSTQPSVSATNVQSGTS